MVAAYSQNGWSTTASLMASYTVPGSKAKLTLRKGDASVVLLFLAEQFNVLVEPLDPKTCGGYNPRSIIGARQASNHASGTAEDLNWQKHARGVKGTFSAAKKAAVLEILAFINRAAKVVRWGELYVSAMVDGMHFELVGTPKEIAAAADRIRAWRAAGGKILGRGASTVKPPAKNAPGSRTLQVKAPALSGPDVDFVRRFIGTARCGTGTKYDAKMAAGVRWYQGLRGITADGIAGKQTWSQMGVRATY